MIHALCQWLDFMHLGFLFDMKPFLLRRMRVRETLPILGRDLIGITFTMSSSRWVLLDMAQLVQNVINGVSKAKSPAFRECLELWGTRTPTWSPARKRSLLWDRHRWGKFLRLGLDWIIVTVWKWETLQPWIQPKFSQVVRVGSKKTAFANFSEIAKMLHRQPKVCISKSKVVNIRTSMVVSWTFGTTTFSISAFARFPLRWAGNKWCHWWQQPTHHERLNFQFWRDLSMTVVVLPGRFQQKHIENVLRRYIKEYVTCHTCRYPPEPMIGPMSWNTVTCRSPDTILNKETRLFFLQCMTCHSSCSVQTIKTGFQVMNLNAYFDLLLIFPFPGRHWKEKVTSSQDHLDPFLGCLDHHPGHPGFATPCLSLYLSGLAFVIFWISPLLLQIVLTLHLVEPY